MAASSRFASTGHRVALYPAVRWCSSRYLICPVDDTTWQVAFGQMTSVMSRCSTSFGAAASSASTSAPSRPARRDREKAHFSTSWRCSERHDGTSTVGHGTSSMTTTRCVIWRSRSNVRFAP